MGVSPSLIAIRRAKKPPVYVAVPYLEAWAVIGRDVFWGERMEDWCTRDFPEPRRIDLTETEARAEAALLNGQAA